MFGANIFLLVISIIELLLLFVAFQQGKGKWEGLWVILVECIAYSANAVSPDADHVTFRLENGMWIEWIRYSGWILTCPVLLMTLVSMTTAEGTKPPTVRLVPLLVANLTLVIAGITSAASLPPVKWYIFALAACFGGVVFSSAIQCFIALFSDSPNAGVRRSFSASHSWRAGDASRWCANAPDPQPEMPSDPCQLSRHCTHRPS